MKRFVTYIYEYERGNRGKNVGFIRTDIRETFCRMEIHIRGLDRFKGKVNIFLVVYDQTAIAIPAADLLISQGTGGVILTCPHQQLGQSSYTINDLQAVVIRDGNGKLLAGCFVKEPAEGILHGSFTEWVSEMPDEQEADPHNMDQTENVHGETDLQKPDPQKQTTSDMAPLENHLTASSNDTSPEEAKEPEKDTPKISYRRIEITDIRSLPRRNWYLCNNSFLVHGFFNYHYLILKTVEEPDGRKRFLGVPGIYEQPERMMALLFGFPEFEASREAEQNHPQPDENANGAFGYWMCQLSEE